MRGVVRQTVHGAGSTLAAKAFDHSQSGRSPDILNICRTRTKDLFVKRHHPRFAAALAVLLALCCGAVVAQTVTPVSVGSAAAADTGAVTGDQHIDAKASTLEAASAETLASSIVGMSVYGKPGNGDARKIGEVTDLILDANRRMVGLVVGMGGFLGIGRKDVVIPWTRVERINPEAETARVDITAEELAKAPVFTAADKQQMKERSAIRDRIVSRTRVVEK